MCAFLCVWKTREFRKRCGGAGLRAEHVQCAGRVANQQEGAECVHCEARHHCAGGELEAVEGLQLQLH